MQYIRSRQNRKLQLAQLGWRHNKEGNQDAKMENLMAGTLALSVSLG